MGDISDPKCDSRGFNRGHLWVTEIQGNLAQSGGLREIRKMSNVPRVAEQDRFRVTGDRKGSWSYLMLSVLCQCHM